MKMSHNWVKIQFFASKTQKKAPARNVTDANPILLQKRGHPARQFGRCSDHSSGVGLTQFGQIAEAVRHPQRFDVVVGPTDHISVTVANHQRLLAVRTTFL